MEAAEIKRAAMLLAEKIKRLQKLTQHYRNAITAQVDLEYRYASADRRCLALNSV
jgi:hypothetical protein